MIARMKYRFIICMLCLALSVSGVGAEEAIRLDSYGGAVSLKGEATGRFHLEELNGRHSLVTPDGHGFFSLGITHTAAISRQGEGETDLFNERFGGDWERYSEAVRTNLKGWGYNTIGYDSPHPLRSMMPYLADSYPSQTSAWRPDEDFAFPDVFDSKWKRSALEKIRGMIGAERGNTNLIGYYWTDIPQWDLKRARATRGTDWVSSIRELPAIAPGRRRYERFLAESGENASDEAFLKIIAREYYSTIGRETRRLDPRSIVFGERYLFLDVPEFVLEEALPWIDAIAFQPGGSKLDGPMLDRLYAFSGKPILICDHQCSFPTAAYPKTMWRQLPSEEAVGEAHAEYLAEVLSKPYILGYHRCQYIDRFNAASGVLKQGLIRQEGLPYYTLARSVAENNRMALQRFVGLVN